MSSEILIQILVFALAGYTVGRTLIQEDFAQNWLNKLICWTFAKDNEEEGIFVIGNEVLQRVDTEDGGNDLVVLQDNTYLLPSNAKLAKVARPFSILLHKVGELLGCVYCLSGQTALQLAFWTIGPWAFLPAWVSIVLAVPAITYVINDYLNAEN